MPYNTKQMTAQAEATLTDIHARWKAFRGFDTTEDRRVRVIAGKRPFNALAKEFDKRLSQAYLDLRRVVMMDFIARDRMQEFVSGINMTISRGMAKKRQNFPNAWIDGAIDQCCVMTEELLVWNAIVQDSALAGSLNRFYPNRGIPCGIDGDGDDVDTVMVFRPTWKPG